MPMKTREISAMKNQKKRVRERLNITIHPSILGPAMKLAQSQRRSLSNFIESLLDREIDGGQSLPKAA